MITVAKNLRGLPRTCVAYLHYDGKRLVPWLITRTSVKRDAHGREYEVEETTRRSDGHLIVLRTSRRGDRTLIEQPGHPVPQHLANALGARIKHLKQRAAA
jgi:hypothetical protein